MALAPRKHRHLSFTPAQVLAIGFAAMIATGTVLLALPIAHEPGKSLNLVDALFMATSAVCVTGLAVVDVASTLSLFGEIVLLLLVQSGGLGIMTLSALMFLMMGRRIGLQERLVMQEALGSFSIAGVVRLTKTIIITTLAIEAIGAVLLTLRFLFYYPAGQAVYFGIFHAVSAFNNAGFDLTSASLRIFNQDPYVLCVVAGLIVLGSLGFGAIQEILKKRKWELFSLQTRLVLIITGLLIVGGGTLILLLEYSSPGTLGPMSFLDKVVNALFTSVTFRTAGFESVSSGSLSYAALIVGIVLMFIGGSPGGTGGGIKTTSLAVIVLAVLATVRGDEHINVMGRRLPRDLFDRAVAIAAIALGMIVTAGVVLLVTENAAVVDPDTPVAMSDVLFEGTSAFATVGLTTGMTPHLTVTGRLLIALTMYLGRIGPLTAAVALAQRRRARIDIQYPEERVMIG